MRGLENKRVVITGGASGIGFATAVRFLDEGAQVVILDRDQKAGEKANTIAEKAAPARRPIGEAT